MCYKTTVMPSHKNLAKVRFTMMADRYFEPGGFTIPETLTSSNRAHRNSGAITMLSQTTYTIK